MIDRVHGELDDTEKKVFFFFQKKVAQGDREREREKKTSLVTI